MLRLLLLDAVVTAAAGQDPYHCSAQYGSGGCATDVTSAEAEASSLLQVGVQRFTESGALAKLQEPHVQKIFYINLLEDWGRRKFMMDALAANGSGIPVERWNATTKDECEISGPCKDFLATTGVDPSYLYCDGFISRRPGMEACFMSHQSLLHHISELPGDPEALYMVLEDDVDVQGGWAERLNQLWPLVPSTFDMLKLGFWGDVLPGEEEAQNVFDVRRSPSSNFEGLQSYIVTPRGAKAALSSILLWPVSDVDYMLRGDSSLFSVYALLDMVPYFLESSAVGGSNIDGANAPSHLLKGARLSSTGGLLNETQCAMQLAALANSTGQNSSSNETKAAAAT